MPKPLLRSGFVTGDGGRYALKQIPFRQHAFVYDADDFNNTLGGQPIKYDVAPLGVLSVARTYLIASLPQVRLVSQKVGVLVELEDIVVSLISTPFTLRV